MLLQDIERRILRWQRWHHQDPQVSDRWVPGISSSEIEQEHQIPFDASFLRSPIDLGQNNHRRRKSSKDGRAEAPKKRQGLEAWKWQGFAPLNLSALNPENIKNSRNYWVFQRIQRWSSHQIQRKKIDSRGERSLSGRICELVLFGRFAERCWHWEMQGASWEYEKDWGLDQWYRADVAQKYRQKEISNQARPEKGKRRYTQKDSRGDLGKDRLRLLHVSRKQAVDRKRHQEKIRIAIGRDRTKI